MNLPRTVREWPAYWEWLKSEGRISKGDRDWVVWQGTDQSWYRLRDFVSRNALEAVKQGDHLDDPLPVERTDPP